MKKIIIVNNNMKVGGIQKSLYNLLWSIHEIKEYDITLLLFSKVGEYADKLPKNIRIIECEGPFSYLGKNQDEFRSSYKDTVLRGIFALSAKIFGRYFTLKLMLVEQSELNEEFDCAISFLHNGRKEAFYGGAQDYVLSRIKAKKKITFFHADYRSCGANHKQNNKMMFRFDKIAACSDGCRKVIEETLPELKAKCVTVKNFHRFDEITKLAENNTEIYDNQYINLVSVARLSHEKGIERAIKAVQYCIEKGIKVRLHIVGDGAMRSSLEQLSVTSGTENAVIFYGEQSNPYRYMKNADLFVLSSYHEAAPMVIDEARGLGIPILTTETTSSEEMVTAPGCGWVCKNSQEDLSEALYSILSDKNLLASVKNKLLNEASDNKKAEAQFKALIEN